jgi:hypothetical protein
MPVSATTSPTQFEFPVVEPITDNPVRIRPASRGFVRYTLAICIGVAATLAWQSYGHTAKQIIATRVTELGWSPETKQTIANWVEQLGWTKLSTTSDAAARPSLPETVQGATSSRKQMPITPPSRAPNHRTDLTHNESFADIRN